MSEYLQDHIEDCVLVAIESRYEPIPRPYIEIVRERFVDGVVVEEVSRKRIYDSIL